MSTGAPSASALTGAARDWVNVRDTSPAAIRRLENPASGRVTVLCFWTTNCINCAHTLPFWNAWAKQYASSPDVAIVGVHTPETRWERDPKAVADVARQRGLAFPILIDNASANWDAYGVQAWPTTLLIDKAGHLRFRWEGELNYDDSGEYRDVQAQIEALRKEKP